MRQSQKGILGPCAERQDFESPCAVRQGSLYSVRIQEVTRTPPGVSAAIVVVKQWLLFPPVFRAAMRSSMASAPPDQPPDWMIETSIRLNQSARKARLNERALATEPDAELKQLREEHTRPAGFDPNRAVMINGRPVVAPRPGSCVSVFCVVLYRVKGPEHVSLSVLCQCPSTSVQPPRVPHVACSPLSAREGSLSSYMCSCFALFLGWRRRWC